MRKSGKKRSFSNGSETCIEDGPEAYKSGHLSTIPDHGESKSMPNHAAMVLFTCRILQMGTTFDRLSSRHRPDDFNAVVG